MRWSRTTSGILLLAIVALLLRIAAVWLVGDATTGPVAYEHGEIAKNLLAGRGFSVKFLGVDGPTSQQAPFYPTVLAGCYALLGETARAIHFLQWIQAFVGMATALCVLSLGWSLCPRQRSIGWIAAWCAAVYPPHVYMVTHVQVVTWACLWLSLLLAIVADSRLAGTWRGAAIAGLIGGLLLLTEPILALALPPAAVMFVQASPTSAGIRWRRHWRALAQAGVLGATAALVIAPWIVRNYRVHGELVFIKSTFGYAFWQGNNAASLGTDKVPRAAADEARQAHDGTVAGINRAMWAARHKTLYIDDVVLTASDYAELARLTEPQRSQLLGARAWDEIRRDPAAYAQRCLSRLRYFLLWDETNPKAASRVYRAASMTWLVLAMVGLLSAPTYWKRWWPTAAIFVLLMLFHTLTIMSVRFRFPLEPFTFVWAAVALLPLARIVSALLTATRPSFVSRPFQAVLFGANRRPGKAALRTRRKAIGTANRLTNTSSVSK